MSRIYFHSIDHLVLDKPDVIQTSEVSGMSTRYLARNIARDICQNHLSTFTQIYSDSDNARIKAFLSIIPADNYLHEEFRRQNANRNSINLNQAFRTFLSSFEDHYFLIDGEKIDTQSFVDNTAIVAGSDIMKILTHIDCMCEQWGCIRGVDRSWLAFHIQNAINQGILSGDFYGDWQKIVNHLKQTDQSDIFMSYSACESFPNAYIANWMDTFNGDDDDSDDYYDQFDKLPEKEQWDMASVGHEKRFGSSRLISPENITELWSHEWHAFRLHSYLWNKTQEMEKINE